MTNNTALPLTARAWLSAARRALIHEPDAALEASLLLAHVLEKSRAWLLAHPEAEISPEQETLLTHLLAQRSAGTPLPYLLGHWEFFGLDFVVTPAVLIPRPETEILVEAGLAWLAQRGEARVVDVGTGSGCIAVALAKHAPSAQVFAVDRSRAALQVAALNAQRHGAALTFWQGSLLSALDAPLDLVCANLPYIPAPALAELPLARYEPRAALEGGVDGLLWISALLEDAPRWIAAGGRLLLEVQYDQGAPVAGLARRYLPHAQVQVLRDFAGLERVVDIQLP